MLSSPQVREIHVRDGGLFPSGGKILLHLRKNANPLPMGACCLILHNKKYSGRTQVTSWLMVQQCVSLAPVLYSVRPINPAHTAHDCLRRMTPWLFPYDGIVLGIGLTMTSTMAKIVNLRQEPCWNLALARFNPNWAWLLCHADTSVYHTLYHSSTLDSYERRDGAIIQ